MSPHDWNAEDYDATNAGIIELGRRVLDRLPLDGDETVLDAGCGTGVLTAELLERLPHGRVIALDAAPSMLAAARERFAGDSRVEVVQGDLYALDLGDRSVDAVFSTATFHWIKDHDALWRGIRGALVDGGRLVAQCGGEGNIDSVMQELVAVSEQDPYAEFVGGWLPNHFAGAEETEQLLLAAGISEARCWLEPAPVHPADVSKHLREVILGAHKERLPADLFEPFAAAVDARLGERDSVDYVRLNIDATA